MSSLNCVESCCLTCNLRKRSFFCHLSQSSVAAVNRIKHAAVFPEHSVVLVEGQKPSGVFILCRGRAKLSTTSQEGKTPDCSHCRGRRSRAACRHNGWSLRIDGRDRGALPVGFRGKRRYVALYQRARGRIDSRDSAHGARLFCRLWGGALHWVVALGFAEVRAILA
jgi:hypothetical protein